MPHFEPVELESPTPIVPDPEGTNKHESRHNTIIERSYQQPTHVPSSPSSEFSAQSQAQIDAWMHRNEDTTAIEGLPTVDRAPHTEAAIRRSSVIRTVPIEEDPETPFNLSDRYDDLGLIASGGMGEVRRVKDRELNRVMAMKILRRKWLSQPEVIIRFLEEAQTTSQLQHPGVAPVHEMGYLPDGRIYFTMREVRGQTLSDAIESFHILLSNHSIDGDVCDSSFRKLLEAFQQVCEVIHWVHSRGVVHRDLKPENIIISRFNEAIVVDWGLARISERQDAFAAFLPKQDEIHTHRSQNEAAWNTHLGEVIGTPAYMPPEQARGEHDQLGPTADIYALGAILYEILAGRPPYEGESFARILYQVLEGPPPPPTPHPTTTPNEWTPPAELIAMCSRAMERTPEHRYRNAGQLANDIQAWLQPTSYGHFSNASLLKQAKEQLTHFQQRTRQACMMREQAHQTLQQLDSYHPDHRKEYGWSLQDEAAQLQRQAQQAEHEALHLLQSILLHTPQQQEARQLLLDHCQQQHQRAESTRQTDQAHHYMYLLTRHDKGSHAQYIKGNSTISLRLADHSHAPRARILHVQTNNRKWTLDEREQLPLPIQQHILPSGRYLLKLEAEQHHPITYPIWLQRGRHEQSLPPGQTEPQPIELPKHGSLSEHECFVHRGYAWFGGDQDAPHSIPLHRVWLEHFAIQTHPVTHKQYIAFLNDLLAQGRDADALRFAPQKREGKGTLKDKIFYKRDKEGQFVLSPEHNPMRWELHTPVTMVDWFGARAWAEWYANQTGQPWRLPFALEWEKAARGPDNRLYPWGDYLDPSWCCMQASHATTPQPVSTRSYPFDQSPYGVRGMAGNVREWCLDLWTPEGHPAHQHTFTPPETVELPNKPPRGGLFLTTKGGSWSDPAPFCRAASRRKESPHTRKHTLGFRVVRSVPSTTQ